MSEPVRRSVGFLHSEPAARGTLDIPAVDVTALDETQLIDEIDFLPASQWPWGVPQKARIQVLRLHPEPHCTFEIDLSTEDGWHRLIGKVYATDRQDVYQVMQALRWQGLARKRSFRSPERLLIFHRCVCFCRKGSMERRRKTFSNAGRQGSVPRLRIDVGDG